MSSISTLAFFALGMLVSPLAFILPGVLMAEWSIFILSFLYTYVFPRRDPDLGMTLIHTVMIGSAWVASWMIAGWIGSRVNIAHCGALQVGVAVGSAYLAFMLWAFSGGSLANSLDRTRGATSAAAPDVESES